MANKDLDIHTVNEVLNELSSEEKTTTTRVTQEVITRLTGKWPVLDEKTIRCVVNDVAKSREDFLYTRGGRLQRFVKSK